MLRTFGKHYAFTSKNIIFITMIDIICHKINIVKYFLKKYQGFCFSLKSQSNLFIIIMIIKERLISYGREQIKDDAQGRWQDPK